MNSVSVVENIACEETVGTCVYYCDTSVLVGPTLPCLADPICIGACGCSDDWDADGMDNTTDNCKIIYNPDQSDAHKWGTAAPRPPTGRSCR